MTSLEQIIETYSQNLSKEDAKRAPFKHLSEDTDNTEFNGISAEADIQATMQKIRMMKIKQIELGIKEAFLRRILEAKTPEEAIPTSQDVAKLDLSLGKEKSKLRSIKAARAEAEKKLPEMARTVESATASRDRARSEAVANLRRAKAASRLQIVKDALETGDPDELHKQVGKVDEHDAVSCQHLLRELRSQKRQYEKEASSQSTRSGDLCKEVDALENKDKQLEAEHAALQQRISEYGNNHSDMSALRKEWTRQEKLGELMSAFVGFRIMEMRRSGLTLQLDATVFAKKGDELRSNMEPTHTLDVEFDANDVGDTVIAHMFVDPPDVVVSDLVKDLDLSMEKGIGFVFSRFKNLYDKQTTHN